MPAHSWRHATEKVQRSANAAGAGPTTIGSILMSLFRLGALRVVALACIAATMPLVAGCGGGSGGGSGGESSTPAPSSLSYAAPPTLVAGLTIAVLSPHVTGTVSSYSVQPALPLGLTLDGNTGVISGTPTTAAAAATYTVTASNSGGSTTFSVTIAVASVSVLAGGNLARTTVAGTSIYADVRIIPMGTTFAGTLYARASDPVGVFLAPIGVMANGDGSYTLELATSPSAMPGEYASRATLSLCADAACTTPQMVPSVAVDFDVNVMTATSNWPGNHLTALSAWPGVADWATFQGNAAHTGFVPVTLSPDALTTRWQLGITSMQVFNSQFNLATVTTSGGQFFMAGGNAIVARSEFDASQNWKYDFSGLPFPSSNPPAVSGGVVYVAAGQQSSTYMFALDAATGALSFRSQMSSQWENYLAPTVGPRGIYTNAGTYGGIYGFNSGGQQLLFDGLDQQSIWTPAADATTVYAYTGARLTLVDPVTGAVNGTIVDPTFTNYIYVIGGSVVLGAANSAFAAAYGNSFLNGGAIGNTLLHFNTKALTIDWQVRGDYPSTPAYAEGVVYVANNNPLQLEARDESNGSLLWKWVPPASSDLGFKSEVLLTNNLVFVSTNQSVYAVDCTSHHQVWSYPVTANLALSQNGILYLEGVNTLTAINAK
jgi:Putative Ig domain/PQQ-like domain